MWQTNTWWSNWRTKIGHLRFGANGMVRWSQPRIWCLFEELEAQMIVAEWLWYILNYIYMMYCIILYAYTDNNIYIYDIYIYICHASYKRLYMYIYALNKKDIYIYIYIIILKPMYTCTMRTCSRIFKLSCLICLPFRFLRSASFCISIIALLCTYIHLSYTSWNAYAFSCICYMVECVMNLPPWQNDILVSGQLLYWMAFRDLLQGYFRCCLRHLKSRISIRSSDTRFT